MNIGTYDGIYYYGEYLKPIELKAYTPEIYDEYLNYFNEKFYNPGIFANKSRYVLYALYKNNNITFCKIKYRTKSLSISPFYIMIRKAQKFKIEGQNYGYKNNEIVRSIYIEAIDEKYKKMPLKTMDSTAYEL